MKPDYEVKDMVNDLTRILSDIGHPIPAWFKDHKKIDLNEPFTESQKEEMTEVWIAAHRSIYATSFSSQCAARFGYHDGNPVFIHGEHALCASALAAAAFLQFQVESVILEQNGRKEDVYHFYAANAASDDPGFIVETIMNGFTEIAIQIASGDDFIKPVMH